MKYGIIVTVLKLSRNDALPHARKDASIEARATSVIQTQDSLQQQDIWILTGVLVRYLIRVHYLNTGCYNYNRTLAPYESIDPKMHHDESSGISEFHDTRLSLFAAAMKATFQPHTFNPPPIPEDVLKVTHNRMRKILPPPQSEMKWIIVALFHLMRKEAEYYYTHVSLKYLYIYLTSASQQLNGPNRNLLTRQQSQQLLQKRHQCE
nr:unnamed protein product [Callosobruchus chinensis]